jgi:hypothetical protein
MTAPIGTTHTADFYGDTHFYKIVYYPHLNQVYEEWQTRANVYWWDLGKWVDVGPGFSGRKLKVYEEPLRQVLPHDARASLAGHAVR